VALAGQAVSRFAAVMKGLDAGERNADGIAIVTMRRKRAPAKPGFQPLNALAAPANSDAGPLAQMA